jgi:hypothetical protein
VLELDSNSGEKKILTPCNILCKGRRGGGGRRLHAYDIFGTK